MAKGLGKVVLSDGFIVTVVSRLHTRVIVEDMSYGEAKGLLELRDGWHHIFYEQGFTSIKGNTLDRRVNVKSPVPPPPL